MSFLNRATASLIILTVMLISEFSAAQQTEEDVVKPPVFKLLYIEAPVVIIEGSDVVIPQPAATTSLEDDPAFQQRVESILQYNEAVRDLEDQGGIWDMALVEELVSLGSLQQQQGYHLEAVETFNRAVHINRINSGLHSLEQVPAVEQMIDSYLAMGLWEEADLYYNYLFYVQHKAYGSEDPRLIPILDSLANWNMTAFNMGFGEALGVRLSSAQILYTAAARMVGIHFGFSDQRYAGYMSNIADSAFLVSRNPHLIAELARPEYRDVQNTLLNQLNQNVPIQSAGFATGERALGEIINFYASKNGAAIELAEAVSNLADWYLMFRQRNAAKTEYLTAWEILAQQEGAEELLQQHFGVVRPIPTFTDQAVSVRNDFIPGISADGAAVNFAYADLQFDVSVNGIPGNISVLNEETDQNKEIFSRLRRELRDTFFRPVLQDGKPIKASGNLYRYRYWY